jgi:hypothetical protein
MKTIETEAEVSRHGELTIRLPLTIAPGRHAVVVVVDESPSNGRRERLLADFPVDSAGRWPAGLSLKREHL